MSEEWREHTKCASVDVAVLDRLREQFPDWNPKKSPTELFYPPRNKDMYKPIADEAKAICNGRDLKPPCPVRDQCLLDAIRRDDPHGIYGGRSHRERNALVRKYPVKASMTMLDFVSAGGPS